MEQEIEELKAKLLRAEELIQEIQVRRWPGGAEGGRGAAGPRPLSLFPCPPSPETAPESPFPARLHGVAPVPGPISPAGAS